MQLQLDIQAPPPSLPAGVTVHPFRIGHPSLFRGKETAFLQDTKSLDGLEQITCDRSLLPFAIIWPLREAARAGLGILQHHGGRQEPD